MTDRYTPTWARVSIPEMAESIAAGVIDYHQRQRVTRDAVRFLVEVRQQGYSEGVDQIDTRTHISLSREEYDNLQRQLRRSIYERDDARRNESRANDRLQQMKEALREQEALRELIISLGYHLTALCNHPTNYAERYNTAEGRPCPGCYDARDAYVAYVETRTNR